MTIPIRFDDGAAYDRYMGVWSRLVGETFLDWVAPASGLRWLDIGCGNGAFTQLIVRHTAPASLAGIDPSEEQLASARGDESLRGGDFRQGSAMELPFGDDAFDAAVMPLVIFFVPDPAQGLREMVRVVSPGGLVCAYAWDMAGGGFPYWSLQNEMREMGAAIPAPPSPQASELEVMEGLWIDAGLEGVETRVITVERTFASFDEYWAITLTGPSVGPSFEAMGEAKVAELKERMRGMLVADAHGRITCSARAHAVQGRVAG
jgi:SAM-dependent methyltransferase